MGKVKTWAEQIQRLADRIELTPEEQSAFDSFTFEILKPLDDYLGRKTVENIQGGNKVIMISPEGEPFEVDIDGVEEALKHGWTRR